MKHTIRVLAAVALFGLTFSVPTSVQGVDPASVLANAPDLAVVAHGVPVGGELRVLDIYVDQDNKTDLELTRFNVFTPDTTVVVVDGPETAVPDTAYFRGHRSDNPDSLVVLAVPADGSGKPHGLIVDAGGAWLMEKGEKSEDDIRTRKIDLENELSDRTFTCGSDVMNAARIAASTQNGLSGAEQYGGIPLPLDVRYTAHMIVDTDYEYWQKFWNMYQPNTSATAAAALGYLGDLFAYVSTVYEREINTNFVIDYARLFATNSDPYSENDDFCGCDGNGKLDEVQDVWDGNSTPRTAVHFVSGKTEGCGCAYVGVLCSQGDGYGASSSIGTGFNIDNPGFMWESVVIAHEIGHNFNSQHTHNYCGEYGISDPIDICVDEATDDVSNCLGDNNASLPGLDSLTGGTASSQNGTIMSYCHLRTGGQANIAHTFGLYHPYGKAPWREATKMLAHVMDSTSCMDLEYTGSGLRLTKDCKPDDPMQVGETATCTITVQNLGPDIAQGVVIVDDYVSNGNFSFGDITMTKYDQVGNPTTIDNACTSTPNLQMKSGNVRCNDEYLDAGHKTVVTIDVTANRAQNINDRAEVTSDSPDPDLSDNVATDEVNVVEFADLSVTKVCKPDVPQPAGLTATCEMVVTNHGPSAARGVHLVDTLTSAGPFPYNVTSVTTTKGFCGPGPGPVNSSPRVIDCNIGMMWPGSSETVKVNVTSNEGIDINDVVNVASTATAPEVPSYDPDVNNNTAQDGVSFVSQADLSIDKHDGADPVVAGGLAFGYFIDVENNGPSKARNVVVTDQVPAGLEIIGVSTFGSGTCNAGVPGVSPTVCALDTINASAMAHIQITVRALPDTRGILTNDASVTSDTADPDNSNNLDTENTTVNASADIAVSKVRTSAEVVAGAEVDYQVTVTNNGPSTATNVTLVDSLDPYMAFVSSVPGCVENPQGTLTCALGTLDPGESTVVFLTVQLNPATPDGQAVSNSATGSAAEPDPDLSNNTSMTNDNVTTRADLWLDKVQNDPTGNPSGTLIYSLTVHNRPGCELDDQLTCWQNSGGPSDAQNVVVTDTLPFTASKFVVQYVSVGCTYVEATHTVTCNAGTVAYGQSTTFEIQAVTKGSLGTDTNTATVTSSTADPVSANNTDTVKTTVKGGTGRTGGQGGGGA